MYAGVAITSLLKVSKSSYDIYCIINKNVLQEYQKQLFDLVKNLDDKSNITFLYANSDFDNSIFRKWTVGMYYRLMLPKLLPNVKKIIYCDTDVLFMKDLSDLFNVDLDDNYIAGILDLSNINKVWKKQNTKFHELYQGEYINSGVLVMNLDKIRKYVDYDKIISMSKFDKRLRFPDQEIINICFKDKIKFLDVKYNFMVYAMSEHYKLIDENYVSFISDVNDAVILHYAAIKPWNKKCDFSDLWWNVAKQTPFFEVLSNEYFEKSGNSDCKVFLFSFIPLLRIVYKNDKIKVFLFNFIRILLLKRKEGR